MLGAQRPRISLVPEGEDHPDADAVIEFAEALGVALDDWQEWVLRTSLRQRGGLWASFENGVCVPRQNGKNGITEVRELAGPLLLGERLVMHSAHLGDTSREAFRRVDDLIDANEWLSKDVRHIWRTNGYEAIEFRDGRRIRFRTRTKGGGRGFSGDLVVFDEAMYLTDTMMGAVMPVVSARPNPQLWYTGSAVDQTTDHDGVPFTRVRERALAGLDPRLFYAEWSIDAPHPELVPEDVASDPASWATANPALGIRIRAEYVEDERRTLGRRTYAVERLGVWDPPVTDATKSVIDGALWDDLADGTSQPGEPLVLAFDVTPTRSSSSVAICGPRDDDLSHLEVIESRKGAGWLVDYIVDTVERHGIVRVACDGASQAAALVEKLADRGVEVEVLSAKEMAAACGLLFDAIVEDATVRHLAQEDLDAAVRAATTRALGEAWAWSRKNSTADISPLVAVTIAHWALVTLVADGEPLVAWA